MRQHFEAAIAQEKGRLSCFRFNIGKGASEHLQPVPEDAEPAITAADIVDIATLRRFRKQNTNMPGMEIGAEGLAYPVACGPGITAVLQSMLTLQWI